MLVFRDVTARRIAERELERWKRFFAGAGFGMFVMDPKTGALVDMNTTFAAMHRYSVDELRGMPLAMLAAQESGRSFFPTSAWPANRAGTPSSIGMCAATGPNFRA